jgi:hypothetical protein
MPIGNYTVHIFIYDFHRMQSHSLTGSAQSNIYIYIYIYIYTFTHHKNFPTFWSAFILIIVLFPGREQLQCGHRITGGNPIRSVVPRLPTAEACLHKEGWEVHPGPILDTTWLKEGSDDYLFFVIWWFHNGIVWNYSHLGFETIQFSR